MAHAAQTPSQRPAREWDFYCYNCDGGGHHAYMCPSPRRDGRPSQQQQQRTPSPAGAAPAGQSYRPSQRPPFRPSGGKGGKGGYGRGQRQQPDRRALAHATLADMQWQPAEDGNFYGNDGYSYQEHLSYLLTDMDQSEPDDVPTGIPQQESGFSTHLEVDDQESAFWGNWQSKFSGNASILMDKDYSKIQIAEKSSIIWRSSLNPNI